MDSIENMKTLAGSRVNERHLLYRTRFIFHYLFVQYCPK